MTLSGGPDRSIGNTFCAGSSILSLGVVSLGDREFPLLLVIDFADVRYREEGSNIVV